MAELAGLNREDPVGAIASFGWQRRSGTQLEVQLTNKVVGETEGETTRVAESLQRGEPPDGDASDAQFAGPDRTSTRSRNAWKWSGDSAFVSAASARRVGALRTFAGWMARGPVGQNLRRER